MDHALRDWYRKSPVAVIVGAGVVLFLVIWLVRALAGGGRLPFAGPRFQVVGFYENSTTGSLASLKSHYSAMSQVSPRWFSVTGTGAIRNVGFKPQVAHLITSHHLKLVPLVTNVGSTMLTSPAVRATAARNLAALVRRDHFAGVSIDFELLPPSARNALTALVAAVRKQLGPRPILAVSVFPLVGVSHSVNGAYDYAGLAKSANYLVLMTYDHHFSGGPPGPVAPYPWVAQNVAAATRVVSPRKIVLAIGTYGYDWPNTGSPAPAATVSDVQAKQLAKSHGETPKFDAKNSQNYFTYAAASGPHVVWYMGDRSASARVKLAHQKHLAGVAIWELGDEDPGFWKALATR